MKKSKYNIVIEEDKDYKIIYNSFSKSILKLRKDVDLDLSGEEDNYDKNLLLKNGFLINDSSSSETNKLEFLYRKSFFNSDSLNIILIPSFNCNLKCPYCFEKSHKIIRQEGNFYDAFLKFSQNYFKNFRYVNLSLFGGEPLLEFKKLDMLLMEMKILSKKYNFIFGTSITTNGTLINKEILDKLVDYNCKTLQITLDGSKKTHDSTRKSSNGLGSFELLINIINKDLSEYISNGLIKFILRINLNNNTLEEIYDTLIRIDEKLRAKINLVLRPIYNTDSYNEKNSNEFSKIKDFYDLGNKMGYSIMKNNYFFRSCEACGDENFFYLTPDLNVWKCVNNMNFDGAKIGRITNNGEYIIDIDKVINWYRAADCFSDKKCRECKLLPDCLGGCILYKLMNSERKCSDFNLVSLPYVYE